MRKSNVTDDEIAEVAYEAYCKAVGGKAFNGDALPSWTGLKAAAEHDAKKENIVVAWRRAGRAVASLVEKKMPAPVPVAAPSATDPSKIAPFPGPVASSSMPPPSRTLSKRTRCCGSFTLALVSGGNYKCPCGDTTLPPESIN